MLTAEHIRAHNHCGCANCEAVYLAELQEDAMVEDLVRSMNDAGLDIVREDEDVKFREARQVA